MQKTTLQFEKISSFKAWAKHFAYGSLISFCIVAFLVLGFFATHSYYRIQGSSMEPGIARSGYSCYISPQKAYTYGDIVISYDEEKHQTPVIKRVIATGGDMVGFYLNTSPSANGFEYNYYQIILIKKHNPVPVLLEEEYLYAGITNPTLQNEKLANNIYTYQDFLTSPEIAPKLWEFFYNGQPVKLLPIAEDEVFILGDNRKVSQDSSNYGAVPLSSIQGKVDYIFETTTPTILIALKQIFGF